jgi:anaerobic selenocysteine-containing dehydrogenase
MSGDEMVATTCQLCPSACGVLVHLSDGKPVRVEGDPDYPLNKGALCPIGMASLEYLYHPDRLKHPLKRAGNRGEGKWQQVTWDEALDMIAAELTKVKEKYGAKSIVFIRGGTKGYSDAYVGRFANVFGTPNVASMAPLCHVPRERGSSLTYGFMAAPDLDYPPSCIIMWGANAGVAAITYSMRKNEASLKGSKLVVIDPAETEYTRMADIWIKPMPSSDLALALGMINVIINENLYDKDFVDNWTVGFEQLRDHVQDYPPEKVEEITWVPKETIREVAKTYATNKPACSVWGNGIDTNVNSLQCARAIAILRAITGNIGRPGGDMEWTPSGIVPKGSPELNQQDALTKEVRAKRVSAKDGILPINFYALPQTLVKAMIKADPYPIRAAFLAGASLLQCYPNAQETRRALESLDFLVAADLFMTPTTELADIVLPVKTYLEMDGFHESLYMPIVGVIQKVAQIDECWSDYKIFEELAKRLGLGEYFPDEKEFLEYIFKPTGLTFDEFRRARVISGKKQYRNYRKNGFKTPSGKVELYSSKLEGWGFDPLPVYHIPPESVISEPELTREYPLIFTNKKSYFYQHSRGRQIETSRSSHPEPLVTIHTQTAGKLGIAQGDQAYIETKRGKIRHKAILTSDIDPRVIIGDYGWWFPEKPASEQLHGWAESNLNILTDNKQPYGKEMGTPTLKGMLCKVYKA